MVQLEPSPARGAKLPAFEARSTPVLPSSIFLSTHVSPSPRNISIQKVQVKLYSAFHASIENAAQPSRIQDQEGRPLPTI